MPVSLALPGPEAGKASSETRARKVLLAWPVPPASLVLAVPQACEAKSDRRARKARPWSDRPALLAGQVSQASKA